MKDFESNERKMTLRVQRNCCETISDFLEETLQAKRKYDDIFKELNENK